MQEALPSTHGCLLTPTPPSLPSTCLPLCGTLPPGVLFPFKPVSLPAVGHRVSIVRIGGLGTSPVQMSLSTGIMQELGIMTEGGAVLDHAVDISILPVMEEESWQWGQESTALQHTTSLEAAGNSPARNTHDREEESPIKEKDTTEEGNRCSHTVFSQSV